MGRYVPKTYYNRRLLRIIVRTVFSAALAILVIFVVLFFALRTYIVPNDDGTLRLEIPWLMDEPPEQTPDDAPDESAEEDTGESAEETGE